MKRRSIFSQLFLATISVFVVSFIITGILLFGFLGKYLTVRYEKELTHTAEQVVNTTLRMADKPNGISAYGYTMYVESVASSTDTEIFVIDAEGTLIASSVSGYSGGIKREFTKDVLKGEKATYRGSVGGIFSADMISVACPIKHSDSVVGGVLVSAPIPEVSAMRFEILKIFIFNVLGVAVAAAFLAYVISRRITKPMLELSRAAKKIASGDFAQRVSVDAKNELGELGETFNNMAESIEQLENMRSSFISNVSHDLRTPMTTIIGFVEGIIDGTIPEEKHKWYLSIVLDESRRLSRIVTDLLDIGKLEQGNFKIEKREFDVNEIIRLNIIKFEKRITEKNIQLVVGFEGENLKVFADKDAISRVLTNLFDNAIKFTQNGGFIDINTGTKNGKAYFSIQNSGVGIDKKDLIHIFDRFYKSDKSRSLDKNGAGLGLYIVKSIIKAHGENVWAESEPDEFTRFSFTLEKAPEKRQTEEL